MASGCFLAVTEGVDFFGGAFFGLASLALSESDDEFADTGSSFNPESSIPDVIWGLDPSTFLILTCPWLILLPVHSPLLRFERQFANTPAT